MHIDLCCVSIPILSYIDSSNFLRWRASFTGEFTLDYFGAIKLDKYSSVNAVDVKFTHPSVAYIFHTFLFGKDKFRRVEIFSQATMFCCLRFFLEECVGGTWFV